MVGISVIIFIKKDITLKPIAKVNHACNQKRAHQS